MQRHHPSHEHDIELHLWTYAYDAPQTWQQKTKQPQGNHSKPHNLSMISDDSWNSAERYHFSRYQELLSLQRQCWVCSLLKISRIPELVCQSHAAQEAKKEVDFRVRKRTKLQFIDVKGKKLQTV